MGLLLVLLSLISSTTAQAGDQTWTGGASDNTWTSVGNWTSAVPDSTGTAYFVSGSNTTIAYTTGTVAGLVFDGASSTIRLV